MDNRSVTLFLVCVLYARSSMDQHLSQPETHAVVALTGQNVDLLCGDNQSVSANRYWKREEELLTVNSDVLTKSERIKAVNQSVILRINNVSVDDEGRYTCIIIEPTYNVTYNLQVKRLTCKPPDEPVNGSFRRIDNSVDDVKSYTVDDRIVYVCKGGFQLVGEAISTCSGATGQWLPHTKPHCQPEYMVQLMRRLDGIENDLADMRNHMSVMEDNILELMNNTLTMGHDVSDINDKMAHLEVRLSCVEGNISTLLSPHPRANVTRERLIACTGQPNSTDEDTVSKCMTMQMGTRNGRNVSEFKWVVRDFDSKVPIVQNNSLYLKVTFNNATYMSKKYFSKKYYSGQFYHAVPGYRMRLRLRIYSTQEWNIRLMLLPTEYDDQLQWPFNTRFDITVLTTYGEEVLYYHFPSYHPPLCKSGRPKSETSFECHTFNSGLINHGDFLKNKLYILKDGSMEIKIYLYH